MCKKGTLDLILDMYECRRNEVESRGLIQCRVSLWHTFVRFTVQWQERSKVLKENLIEVSEHLNIKKNKAYDNH